MALPTLINLERTTLGITSATATDQRLLDQINYAVSDAIRKYCRRDFTLRNYDELYDGNSQRELLLRQYPIQEVQSVRYRPVTVLRIINLNTTLNQQARVQVYNLGVTLIAVASGVMTRTNLTFATYPTLANLATQINTLSGSGWNAQVQTGNAIGDYSSWPSADLYVAPSFGDAIISQGAMSARNQYAELKMHTYELQGFQWDYRGYLYRAIPYSDPELLHPEDLIWPPGVKNFRIQYAAGYSEIPPAVEEAAVEWISAIWYLAARDPSLKTQVPASGTTSGWGLLSTQFGRPPDNVCALLQPYRRISVSNW